MFYAYPQRLERSSGRNLAILAERLSWRQRRLLCHIASFEPTGACAAVIESTLPEGLVASLLRLDIASLAELDLVMVYPGESRWCLSCDGKEAFSWFLEPA